MIRRHSHSGHPSEQPETDWFQDSLTPSYLRKPKPVATDLPSVEPETPEQITERSKEPVMAVHMTLLERYEQETK